MSKLTSVNLVAPINTVSYGIVSLNILKELSKVLDVSLWPIGEPQITNQNDYDIFKKAILNAQSYDPKAPCIRIWHQFDLAQFVGNGPHIGFPIFELDEFTKAEKHQLESVDHLFVCSNWAKEVVQKNIGEYHKNFYRTHVVPLGVDTNIFVPTQPVPKKNFVFLNCGKWEVRKGHDILCEAFNSAFSDSDDVELWLMTHNLFSTNEEKLAWERKYIDTPLFKAGKIKFIPRVDTHEEVYKIMANADCGVFPSRAEGWNLEALEMLSVGRPLVITDYSAHKDFCNTENSTLIPTHGTELAFDNKWFFGQGKWATLKVGEVAKAMRVAYDKGRMYNKNGVDIATKFSWKNTAKEIINVLESI